MARTRSRRYRKGAELVDRTKVYEPTEALEILKKFPGPKFEESVEIAVRLGIDPKKTDQLVRGSVSLPKGTGKQVRIAVFAEGDKAEAARGAGVGEVWIDPGIGFGKTAAHNWALLNGLADLVATGWPLVVGTSRKAFLGALFADADGVPAAVEDRLEGSVTTAVMAAADGASMVRVHDVGATVAALEAAGAGRSNERFSQHIREMDQWQ